jgi:hypothetical protein
MPRVQQVENTIGEDDASVLFLPPATGTFPVADALGGIDDAFVAQKIPSACGFR